jgi:hypothetical protein
MDCSGVAELEYSNDVNLDFSDTAEAYFFVLNLDNDNKWFCEPL